MVPGILYLEIGRPWLYLVPGPGLRQEKRLPRKRLVSIDALSFLGLHKRFPTTGSGNSESGPYEYALGATWVGMHFLFLAQASD